MDTRKDLLLKSVARLYSLGVDLEMARDRLKNWWIKASPTIRRR